MTIYAPATGPGVIGIVRLSGPRALDAARALTRDPRFAPSRTPRLRRLYDPRDGGPLDEVLLLFFAGPNSATGEDVLEIQHHGSIAIQGALLAALGTLPGLRPAAPGEFTKRAFLNGRIDLTAAEGLDDLLAAQTLAQARQALRQLDGALGRLYRGWRETALAALARIEAEIDFAAEEEVPDDVLAGLRPKLTALLTDIEAHLHDAGRGERLRAGFQVAVTGPPNVGKSSLVNSIAGRDVAIVTPIAGTTRDVIEVALDLEGLPITLLDTAGLRESDDPIERIGIERARARADNADLVLRLADDPTVLPSWDQKALVVLSKADRQPAALLQALPVYALPVSAATGYGVDALLRALSQQAARGMATGEVPALTRARQRIALSDARAALARALTAEAPELALIAEDIRLAARALGSITGEVGVEEVLDRIFDEFCIGK